jgi:Phospholipase_D-nuclease N-terminal
MDFITIGILLALLAVVVVTIRDIWRNPGLGDGGRLLWTLVVVMFPLVGAVAWFVVRPRVDATPTGRH